MSSLICNVLSNYDFAYLYEVNQYSSVEATSPQKKLELRVNLIARIMKYILA
jgi:hypothetical protein